MMRIINVLIVLCVMSVDLFGHSIVQNNINNVNQKRFSIAGTIWSKGKEKVWVKKKNSIEYIFKKNGELKTTEAIGPFVSGESSIFGLEYNLDVEHGKPFILNFESWTCKYLDVDGVIFDGGLTKDCSIYWALEGVDVGKSVDTFLMLFSKTGKMLLRQKVVTPGINVFVLNGLKFEIQVRLARGIDLIN